MDRDEYAKLAERESDHWAKLAEIGEQGLSWLHSPTIEEFVNWRVSGDPKMNWFGWVVGKFSPGRTPGPGISLGCNDGFFDRQIMRAKLCTEFDGFDISRAAVKEAEGEARKEGLAIRYHRADLNFVELPEDRYMMAVAVMTLHHVDRLDALFHQVNRALKPNGIFAFNEYVGPNRFQISDRQLEVINHLLPLLPARLRRRNLDGKILDRIDRVRVEDLVEASPFEAIRSEEILPLAERHFTILERRDYGGSILSWLLNYLVPNFREDSEEDRAILALLARVDYFFTECGGMPSDHSVVVATKKIE